MHFLDQEVQQTSYVGASWHPLTQSSITLNVPEPHLPHEQNLSVATYCNNI